jgi:3-dehydroquinate synthase
MCAAREVQTLRVHLGERSYPIWIGRSLLADSADYFHRVGVRKEHKLLIITDQVVGPLYASTVKQCLQKSFDHVSAYTIPAGELSKSLSTYEQIMTYAMEQKLDRNSVILALGGGVVGDIAGFVAATYMRGIRFIQMPTTLLAHDSSVGGKVAINHPLGKNMIGAFHQPQAVLYDTETLTTLPTREIRSGLAEVLKLGFIRDAEFADWLNTHRGALLNLEEPFISEALKRACQIKSDIVSADEKEQGIRALLNLGHTFGHAFEALGEYGKLTHGEAVSIGMVLAARVSEAYFAQESTQPSTQEITQESTQQSTQQSTQKSTQEDNQDDRAVQYQPALEAFVRNSLKNYGLPVEWQELPWGVDEVLDKMYLDKKTTGDHLNLILLSQIGHAELVRDVDPVLIRKIW